MGIENGKSYEVLQEYVLIGCVSILKCISA